MNLNILRSFCFCRTFFDLIGEISFQKINVIILVKFLCQLMPISQQSNSCYIRGWSGKSVHFNQCRKLFVERITNDITVLTFIFKEAFYLDALFDKNIYQKENESTLCSWRPLLQDIIQNVISWHLKHSFLFVLFVFRNLLIFIFFAYFKKITKSLRQGWLYTLLISKLLKSLSIIKTSEQSIRMISIEWNNSSTSKQTIFIKEIPVAL